MTDEEHRGETAKFYAWLSGLDYSQLRVTTEALRDKMFIQQCRVALDEFNTGQVRLVDAMLRIQRALVARDRQDSA